MPNTQTNKSTGQETVKTVQTNTQTTKTVVTKINQYGLKDTTTTTTVVKTSIPQLSSSAAQIADSATELDTNLVTEHSTEFLSEEDRMFFEMLDKLQQLNFNILVSSIDQQHQSFKITVKDQNNQFIIQCFHISAYEEHHTEYIIQSINALKKLYDDTIQQMKVKKHLDQYHSLLINQLNHNTNKEGV